MGRLADQLEAVNEHAFVHGSTGAALYGGRPCTDDWTIAAGAVGGGAPAPRTPAPAGDGTGLDGADDEAPGPEGSAGELGEEVEVAPAGRLPFQEASLQVLSAADPAPGAGAGASAREEEGVPIQGLDLGTLEAYLGVAGASVVKPAVSTPTAAAAGAAAAVLGAAGSGLMRMETGLSEFSQIEGLDMGGAAGRVGSSTASECGGGGAAPGRARDETAAQAAARADFRRDTAGGGWLRVAG